MSPPNATVFVDADNTLWDTDAVFANAQLKLLADVETATGYTTDATDRLAFVRAVDQAIAARHQAGLRYPPHLLARALGLALGGTPSEQAARYADTGHAAKLPGDAEDAIEKAYFVALKQPPALRPGVLNGMTELYAAGCLLLIVTEAAQARVEATATAAGLAGHFTRVVEGQKRPELFTRALRLAGSPRDAFMIGDQLDRDIAPAKQAGLRTIYFPGGFVPRWTPDEGKIGPDYRIADFGEAVAIILSDQSLATRRVAGI